MSAKVSFRFDAEKFANASAYLVERCPAITKMKLSKLLYFADKEHLLTYGRPITGDRYIKMEFGPVPSNGYSLMKGDRISTDQQLFNAHCGVVGKNIELGEPANLNYLSETDREILDLVIQKYGRLRAAKLSKLSHLEETWKRTKDGSEMDYRLMFEGRSDASDIFELVQSDQHLNNALDALD